jgi:hypothetical protein
MTDRRMWFLVVLLVAGLFWASRPAHAYPLRVPVKGYTPPAAPNTPGGTYTVPGSRASNDPQYNSPNGVASNDAIFDPVTRKARTSGAAEIAGVAVDIVADVSIAAAASRVVAAACFSSPVGVAACAGAGMAAWWAAGKIRDIGNGWETEESFFGQIYWLGDSTGLTREDVMNDYTPEWCAANNRFHCYWQIPTNQTQQACWAQAWTECQVVIKYSINSNDLTPDYGVTYTIRVDEGETVRWVPARQADFDAHADEHPIPAAAANESPVPVPVESPAYVPQTVPVADPIPGSTPEDGWEQDVVKVKTNPSPEPQDVEATPATDKADNPDTPEDEGENPITEETPDDPCAINPNTLMCEELGEPPEDEVPRSDLSVEYSAEDLGLPSGCPPDVPMGLNGATFTFGPICEKAPLIRAVVVALSAFTALGICAAALRGAA